MPETKRQPNGLVEGQVADAIAKAQAEAKGELRLEIKKRQYDSLIRRSLEAERARAEAQRLAAAANAAMVTLYEGADTDDDAQIEHVREEEKDGHYYLIYKVKPKEVAPEPPADPPSTPDDAP